MWIAKMATKMATLQLLPPGAEVRFPPLEFGPAWRLALTKRVWRERGRPVSSPGLKKPCGSALPILGSPLLQQAAWGRLSCLMRGTWPGRPFTLADSLLTKRYVGEAALTHPTTCRLTTDTHTGPAKPG